MENIVMRSFEELRESDPEAFYEFNATLRSGAAKKGEILHPIGEVCRSMYVLKSGIIKQIRYKDDGDEQVVWFGFEGDTATAYRSFVYQEPSLDGVEVLEDCEYTVMDRDTCYALAAKYHAMETFFRKLLEYYYIVADERLFFMQAYSAKEKYEYLMKNHPHFIQLLPQKEISCFLGISRETLSRIKRYA